MLPSNMFKKVYIYINSYNTEGKPDFKMEVPREFSYKKYLNSVVESYMESIGLDVDLNYYNIIIEK